MIFQHEAIYRGEETLRKLKDFPVTICGTGALGANLAESLARAGFAKLTVIDYDRIEERNLSTQPWQRGDIGSPKVRVLANALFRSTGIKINQIGKKLEADNARKLLSGAGLVIDTFDNSVGRGIVKETCLDAGIPCLHAGMAGDYAEIIWNEQYRVPSDVNDDVCDYPLARNLVTMTVAITAECIIRFVAEGLEESYTLTLGDFKVLPF